MFYSKSECEYAKNGNYLSSQDMMTCGFNQKAVPDKSDTSTQPVYAFVVCCALSLCHTMVLTFIAFLVAMLVISTCLLDAVGGISSFHYIEIRLAAVEGNQTNFVCDRKNVVIFTNTCFIGSIFQFSSLLL